MAEATIKPEVLHFLSTLEKNNNREWFDTHKVEFKKQEALVKKVFSTIFEKLKVYDDLERLKMFRIYRDVRFSNDKTPYKSHIAGSFIRNGAKLRGGYYMHLKPGNSFIAVGFWDPNKEDLFRIRKELELDAEEFRNLISEPNFQKIWGNLEGEELKTAPKGFDKEHKDIDLIRKKQFIFTRKFSDQEVISADFADKILNSFVAIRPYFDLMSDILTTDLNGESLLH
ncbi:DUF2461 domain-containing protein [Cellulophaga sp. Hel_I_12]|uniref:DUF2461 domain-containing protein n=1 Tax=Cellulophaga sp. Hel_I_12 TaxID=1249972 RepID=UPI00064573F8|nr:DUF2461 domain-containing protein [Cellulophaga sp. Hel_I_12]